MILKEELEYLYYEQGLSFRDIGSLFNKSEMFTRHWFKKYNLKPRDNSESCKLRTKRKPQTNPKRFMGKHLIGKSSWNKGLTKETSKIIKKYAEDNSGNKNKMYGRTGDKHPRWKGLKKNYIKRLDWIKIRKLMKIRDNFTCQACKITEREQLDLYGQPLQVHHLIPYEISREHKEDNLITLCSKCHGLCKNYDFNEELKIKEINQYT